LEIYANERHFPLLKITAFRTLFLEGWRGEKGAEVYSRYTVVLEEKS
jgi:hypothetical protein